MNSSKIFRLTFFFLSIIVLSSVQTEAYPIIDTLSSLGNSLKNNDALDALSLQIVPMTTRIKMASFVYNAYKNWDLQNTLQNGFKTGMNRVGVILSQGVYPVAKDAVKSISDTISPYMKSVVKPQTTQFYEYLNKWNYFMIFTFSIPMPILNSHRFTLCVPCSFFSCSLNIFHPIYFIFHQTFFNLSQTWCTNFLRIFFDLSAWLRILQDDLGPFQWCLKLDFNPFLDLTVNFVFQTSSFGLIVELYLLIER